VALSRHREETRLYGEKKNFDALVSKNHVHQKSKRKNHSQRENGIKREA